MQALFPAAGKPTQPCRVRIFDQLAELQQWRRRLDGESLIFRILEEFYLGSHSVLLADLELLDAPGDALIDRYRSKVGALLAPGGGVDGAVDATQQLTRFASFCVSGEWQLVERALEELVATPPEPIAPAGEPATSDHHYAGYYDPRTLEICLVRGEDLRATLSHEAFHHFLRHNCPGAPLWVDEGLATYFEAYEPRGETARRGLNLEALADLASAPARHLPLVPVAQLLRLEPAAWQARSGAAQRLLYAQSWLLVHYLLHAERLDFGDRGEKMLKGYLAALADGASADHAARDLEEELGGEELDAELRRHLERLLERAR